MNETIQTIMTRRTCRAFTAEAVNEADVRAILDCALRAPSGMGRQTWKFTAVVNREKIQKLAKAVAKATGRGESYDMYQPAVLVITSNDKESPFREVDNACAIENIYLAATSLGLGAVWINQLKDCYDDTGVRAVLDEFRIPAGHGVYGCVAIGHAAVKAAEKQIKGESEIIA